MGSGETTPNGGLVFEAAAKTLPPSPRIGILETPAGFELNSTMVAKRIADYINVRLQNYSPQIDVIAARKKDTPYATNSPENVRSVMACDMVFLGPGSPTYAVRQLKDSLVWDAVRYRFRQGAALVLASAACIAMGKYALPVYEIFKAGEDPHWKPGLDLLGEFGLPCVIIPHWNNAEGGKELDTSRCFIGQERFIPLAAQLSQDVPIIGICEHTGLLVSLKDQSCSVVGKESITVIQRGVEKVFKSGTQFDLSEIGNYQPISSPEYEIDPEIFLHKAKIQDTKTEKRKPGVEVIALLKKRDLAREKKEWIEADMIRKQISQLGWQIVDTPEGSRLEPI